MEKKTKKIIIAILRWNVAWKPNIFKCVEEKSKMKKEKPKQKEIKHKPNVQLAEWMENQI